MPDRAAIRTTLIQYLENDTGNSFADLDDSANLREGLGLDSVDVVSLVSQVERHFKVRLTHEELQTLVTFNDVLDLLDRKLAAAGNADTALEPPASAA